MSLTDTTFIQFDDAKAKTYRPIPQLKIGKIVEKPDDEVTTITASWGTMDFHGSYVQVYDRETGEPDYGCALDEWLAMHERVEGEPDGWVKTASVQAYQTDHAGTLVTRLAGGSFETIASVVAGDWIVRQIGGEVQHIKEAKFPQLYIV